MDPNKPTEVQALLDAVAGRGDVRTVPQDKAGPNIPFAVIPEGYKVHDLEGMLEKPIRVKARPVFHELEGFIIYVNQFKTAATRISAFTDPSIVGEPFMVVAVIDYHEPTNPSWCTHRATLTVSFSDQFLRWKLHSGKWMDQVQLSEHIQDFIEDFVEPKGAAMLELAQTLRVTSSKQFVSSNILKNGASSIGFTEEVNGMGGARGDIEIPGQFIIRIPVLKNRETYDITCRLRYAISQEKKLQVRYDIPRPVRLIDAAQQLLVSELEKAVSVPAILGKLI